MREAGEPLVTSGWQRGRSAGSSGREWTHGYLGALRSMRGARSQPVQDRLRADPAEIPYAFANFDQPTTDPSLKIGRYMPMTMLPTITPIMTMMNGSSRLAKASTALLTSCS